MTVDRGHRSQNWRFSSSIPRPEDAVSANPQQDRATILLRSQEREGCRWPKTGLFANLWGDLCPSSGRISADMMINTGTLTNNRKWYKNLYDDLYFRIRKTLNRVIILIHTATPLSQGVGRDYFVAHATIQTYYLLLLSCMLSVWGSLYLTIFPKRPQFGLGTSIWSSPWLPTRVILAIVRFQAKAYITKKRVPSFSIWLRNSKKWFTWYTK